MEWLAYVVAFFFALLGLLCLVLVVIGLPGTWILIGLAFGVELLDQHYLGASSGVVPTTFGWRLLGACVVLAVVGEILEGMAGAAGTRAGGGSTRGMVGAIIGGIVGAIVLTPIIPIPVIGTLLGALIGTFAGALIAERTGEQPRHVEDSLRAAGGATLGRLFGTFGKLVIAATIWVALSFNAFWI